MYRVGLLATRENERNTVTCLLSMTEIYGAAVGNGHLSRSRAGVKEAAVGDVVIAASLNIHVYRSGSARMVVGNRAGSELQ